MNVDDAACGLFQDVAWVEVTGSTNEDLVAQAKSAPSQPSVLFTDEQTAGRGRRDRKWDMVRGGGLLVSFFVPSNAAADAHTIPTALGVAAIDAIATTGRDVGLKWPNDVIASDHRKVAGMLSEAVYLEGRFVGVVAGLGCNISWPDSSVADEFPGAASLDMLGEDPVDREHLAVALVRAFDTELDHLRLRGPGYLQDRYRTRCRTIGSMVRIDQGEQVVTALATDISPDGSLVVTIDGVQRRIDVGDVVHLRVVDGSAD